MGVETPHQMIFSCEMYNLMRWYSLFSVYTRPILSNWRKILHFRHSNPCMQQNSMEMKLRPWARIWIVHSFVYLYGTHIQTQAQAHAHQFKSMNNNAYVLEFLLCRRTFRSVVFIENAFFRLSSNTKWEKEREGARESRN